MENPNGPMVAAAKRVASDRAARIFYASISLHNLANGIKNESPSLPNLVADAESAINEAQIVISDIKSGK